MKQRLGRRVGGSSARGQDTAASHGMAVARTILIVSTSASLEHTSDATDYAEALGLTT